MKIIKVIVLFFFFFIAGSVLQAQTKSRLPCIDKTFSIVVHVIKDSLKKYGAFSPLLPIGSVPTIPQLIQQTIDTLNAHFAPICVKFEVCEYRYIDNYWYLSAEPSITAAKEFTEMQVLYNAENRINIYYAKFGPLVDSTIARMGNVNNGGILLNGFTNLSNPLISTPIYKILLQSMGEYFGLLPTPGIGGELVNGSNSATAGDLIKDTPADPNGTVDNNCKFISIQKDANNQYYSPIVGDAMSPYMQCLCNSGYAFTYDQYVKMANTYLSNPIAW